LRKIPFFVAKKELLEEVPFMAYKKEFFIEKWQWTAGKSCKYSVCNYYKNEI
jgi:hypothetical protein